MYKEEEDMNGKYFFKVYFILFLFVTRVDVLFAERNTAWVGNTICSSRYIIFFWKVSHVIHSVFDFSAVCLSDVAHIFVYRGYDKSDIVDCSTIIDQLILYLFFS